MKLIKWALCKVFGHPVYIVECQAKASSLWKVKCQRCQNLFEFNIETNHIRLWQNDLKDALKFMRDIKQ